MSSLVRPGDRILLAFPLTVEAVWPDGRVLASGVDQHVFEPGEFKLAGLSDVPCDSQLDAMRHAVENLQRDIARLEECE